jgi:hypothetical protein
MYHDVVFTIVVAIVLIIFVAIVVTIVKSGTLVVH